MKEIIIQRSRVLKSIREFFDSGDFVEVETPNLIPYENPDDNVENVRVSFEDFRGREYRWFLHTSPEFFMKRLVWYGFDRIYQVCKVYRNGEVTELHNVEFTMIEWYRKGATYKEGIEETLELISASAESLGKKVIEWKGLKVNLFEREELTVEEAFKEFAGVKNVFDRDEVEAVTREDYRTGFFKLLVERVEPAISKIPSPVVLKDYPPEFSAMSQVRNGVAERFEVYVAGIELANGYTELRHYEDYLKKMKEKGERAVDRGFLNLLKVRPLPQCEGVALGLDRLLMVLAGKRSIREVIPFSFHLLEGEVLPTP